MKMTPEDLAHYAARHAPGAPKFEPLAKLIVEGKFEEALQEAQTGLLQIAEMEAKALRYFLRYHKATGRLPVDSDADETIKKA